MSSNKFEQETSQLVDYIIDANLRPFPLPEEFFYASLPLCVIDAVFSIGVTYASTKKTVDKFCKRHGWIKSLPPDAPRTRGENKISVFLALLDGLTPEQLANDIFDNRQRTSTRSGILKADAVQRFTRALRDSGIDDFAEMTDTRLSVAEALVRKIPGHGSGISFDYFRMLVGDDSRIKPDRMVQRYIARAIGCVPQRVTPDLARIILKNAISILNETEPEWSLRKLDYAIWMTERSTKHPVRNSSSSVKCSNLSGPID